MRMELHELDSLLEAARRPEKTVRICLRGDLQAEWEDLNDQLTKLQAAPGRKMAGSTDEVELARKVTELEAEMDKTTLPLTLRALPRHEWMKLVRAHPERDGNDEDKTLGVNADTFFDDLIIQSVVGPEGLTEEKVSQLLDSMSGAQYEKVSTAAWFLNRKDVDTPFSPHASRIMQSSAEASKQPSDSGSRRNGSRAGNRKK